MAGACSIMIVPDTSSPVARVRMAGHDVEPAVADAELLPKVATEPLAPAVNAYGIATEGQLVAAAVQPIAQIVVVPVSHPFIEQPDLVESTREVGGVACAHVIDEAAADARIPMLEIASGRSRPEAGATPGDVVPLRGRNLRIGERLEQFPQPAALKDDVLVHLTDDRMNGFPDACIDCGSRSAT